MRFCHDSFAYKSLLVAIKCSRIEQRKEWKLIPTNESFQINEAFASQAIACQRALKIPMELLNVSGGAIALGHPLGASGTRITVHLVHEMM